jgi:hypothetical protein
MAQLTSQQVNQLADYFLAIVQAVGDYRYRNFDNISKSQNAKLKELQGSIRKYADDLYTLSATLVFDDVQSSLSSIGNVTGKLKSAYKILKDVQKAISIAASFVKLGEAILNKNSKAIVDSLCALEDSWKPSEK